MRSVLKRYTDASREQATRPDRKWPQGWRNNDREPELTGRTPVFSWPLAGCAQDSSMNCASTPDGGAVPGDVPADSGGATPGYQDRCRWLAGLREDPEGIASVPAPDSYPHVTCGCPVTGRCPRGVVVVVAPAAPKARHGIDDNTGTLAASAPACRTGPRPAGQQPRCPARSRVRQAGSGRANRPGRSCPGRQRAVPGTGSRPARPGYRAGEGGACRAVNMAHTTFPASPGVV